MLGHVFQYTIRTIVIVSNLHYPCTTLMTEGIIARAYKAPKSGNSPDFYSMQEARGEAGIDSIFDHSGSNTTGTILQR